MPTETEKADAKQPVTGAAKTQSDGTDAANGSSNDQKQKAFGDLSFEEQLAIAQGNDNKIQANKRLMGKDGWDTRKDWGSATEPPVDQAKTEPEPAAEPEATADESEKKEEPASGEEDEDFQTDAKGQWVTRPKRGKELLAAKAERDLMLKQNEELMELLRSKSASPADKSSEPESKTDDPAKVLQTRIEAARAALTKAEEDLDAKAKSAAMEELVDAKSELKALQLTEQLRNEQRSTRWLDEVKEADRTQNEARETLWNQDVKRFPELADETSPMRHKVLAIRERWFREGNQILKNPLVNRIAIMEAAASLGREVPDMNPPAPVATSVKTEPSQNAPVSDRTATLRKNSAVIQGTTPGGSPPMAIEDIRKALLEKAETDPAEVLKILENHQRQLRAMRRR